MGMAQGNYRAIAAADMGKIYSRNIAQQQLYVSKFSQKAVKENQNVEPALAVAKVPDFEEIKNPEDSKAWSKETNGKKPREWALELLKSRQESDVLKRSSETLREASIETLDPDGQPDSAPTIGPEPTQAKKKEKSSKEVLLVTAENIESMNFRFTVETVSRKIIILHMFTLKCHYGPM